MDNRPLRLLSLDGGGVKGLTSLLLLQQIFIALENEVGQGVHPYQYFDLIGGTSTGGLIAIMLGRLRMTIDEAIDMYKKFSPMIFKKKWWTQNQSMKHFGAELKQYWFDGKNLEAAVKDVLKARDLDEDLKLLETDGPNCHVFVCTVSALSTHTELLRSYKSKRIGHQNYDCSVWEAVRATSAAPLFFEPITIKESGTTFVDGGVRANNPIEHLSSEARSLWPGRSIGCLVSLGTGIKIPKSFSAKKSRLHEVLQTLADISTDAGAKAREFRDTQEGRELIRNRKYFRYSVPQGMEEVDLADFEKFPYMESITLPYVVDMDDTIEDCAKKLALPSSSRIAIVPASDIVASSTVPFPRDPKFVERNAIIDAVDSIFRVQERPRRAALYGLGGIGKSQIAIEYSYKVRDDAPDTSVFWVHASSTTRFEQSYREIAVTARIHGHNDPQVDMLAPVLRWLDDKRNGPWLIILDNADDAAVFFDRPPNGSGNPTSINSNRPFINFIPAVPHGMVLVTSRDRTVADNLVGDFSTPIEVNAFDNLQSLDVLRTKLPVNPSEEHDAVELVKELDCIPLAITQAGAYIRQKAPRMTIRKYLSMFRKNNANQATLLNTGAPDLRRDSEVPNAVISTWEISFTQIREQCLPAANLLSLMSLFSRQGIPKFLIEPDSVDEGSDADDVDDLHNTDDQSNKDDDSHDPEIEFEDAIASLIAFSLVRTETNEDVFEMHRLVQVATRTWLKSNGSIQEWEANAIAKMVAKMPNGEYENWKTCAILLPHAKEVITYQPEDTESRLERASLLGNVGWYELNVGNFGIASQMEEESLSVRRQYLHHDDPQVIQGMSNLVITYWKQGRFKEAEDLDVQVLKMRKRVLGAEHPDTLKSISNLASIFTNQGRWKEAEDLNVQALEKKKTVLGAEHPETLTSMNNLAVIFWNQGRLKEAEDLEVQELEIRKRISGAEHPDTLNSISNLASTFWNQGRLKEAEDLEVQVLEIRKRILGAEHPDTLISMSNLALTFKHQGRWKEAEDLNMQALEIRKRVLGAEHPDTLMSMKNLAHTYQAQDNGEKAVQLMKTVAELGVKVWGAEHRRTIAAMETLERWTAP